MDNLSQLWQKLTSVNSEIGDLYKVYKENKANRLKNVLPGRRTSFFTVTEFEFPLTLTFVATDLFSIKPNMASIIKPVVMSTDGIYCISRVGYEAFLELSFTYTSGASVQQRTRRTSMVNSPLGMFHNLIVNPNLDDKPAECFDFEWKIQVGSNDRSYATDAIINNNQNAQGMLSRKCLGSYNNKQHQFHRPYYLDGNEFFTATINPILMPLSNYRLKLRLASLVGLTNLTANIVVSFVTIGHKILGNGHRI